SVAAAGDAKPLGSGCTVGVDAPGLDACRSVVKAPRPSLLRVVGVENEAFPVSSRRWSLLIHIPLFDEKGGA
ncbi:unnamed protein product, partial [Closterium sp. NIES-54]